MGPKNYAVLNRGPPSKELSWLERLNSKLEAFIDVDPVTTSTDLVQQTSQYVETSVTSVGTNMRKLCGDIMRDIFLPPFALDSSDSSTEAQTSPEAPAKHDSPACLSDSASTEKILQQAEAQHNPEQQLLSVHRPGTDAAKPTSRSVERSQKKERLLNAVRLNEATQSESSKDASPGGSQEGGSLQARRMKSPASLKTGKASPRQLRSPNTLTPTGSKVSPPVQLREAESSGSRTQQTAERAHRQRAVEQQKTEMESQVGPQLLPQQKPAVPKQGEGVVEKTGQKMDSGPLVEEREGEAAKFVNVVATRGSTEVAPRGQEAKPVVQDAEPVSQEAKSGAQDAATSASQGAAKSTAQSAMSAEQKSTSAEQKSTSAEQKSTSAGQKLTSSEQKSTSAEQKPTSPSLASLLQEGPAVDLPGPGLVKEIPCRPTAQAARPEPQVPQAKTPTSSEADGKGMPERVQIEAPKAAQPPISRASEEQNGDPATVLVPAKREKCSPMTETAGSEGNAHERKMEAKKADRRQPAERAEKTAVPKQQPQFSSGIAGTNAFSAWQTPPSSMGAPSMNMNMGSYSQQQAVAGKEPEERDEGGAQLLELQAVGKEDADDDDNLPEIGQDMEASMSSGYSREAQEMLSSGFRSPVTVLASSLEGAVETEADVPEAQAWWYVSTEYRPKWYFGRSDSATSLEKGSKEKADGETEWDWELL